MQRRHIIISVLLTAVVLASGLAALKLWRKQQLVASAAGGIPPLPDMSRWPAVLPEEVHKATEAVVNGDDPVGSLGQLATLYHANGFANEAEFVLKKLRELDSGNALWPYRQADLRMRKSDLPGAEAALKATVAVDPGYVPALLRLGGLLSRRNEIGEARDCFNRAVAAAPDNVNAEFAIILFEAQKGHAGDPRKRLMKLVETHGGIRQLHELLAELHIVVGDNAGASQERQRAADSEQDLVEDDPWLEELAQVCYDPNRLILLAAAAERNGQFEEAAILFGKAITLAPSEALQRVSLAQTYDEWGKPDKARAVLEKAVADIPGDPSLRVSLAQALGREGKLAEANVVLREALERWPDESGLYAALGMLLRLENKLNDAVGAFRKAVELDPASPEAQLNLGMSLIKSGEHVSGKAAAETALSIRPDYSDALSFLGSLALEEGDIVAADRYVNQLYSISPKDPVARQMFAGLQLLKGMSANEGGNSAEAAQLFQAGLNVAPGFPPLLLEGGQLALRTNRTADAIQLFERLVQVASEDAGAYLLLGRALDRAGRTTDARQVFEQGLIVAKSAGDESEVEELTRALGN